MLKKTITYADFNGDEVTEDFYFNLSKAEIAELELKQKGGLVEYLTHIVEAEDGEGIIDTFKKIILLSVGRRSEDGKRFIKNDEIRDEFVQLGAYSELFMELVTNVQSANEFVLGIVPSDISKKAKDGDASPVLSSVKNDDDEPAWIKEDRNPTEKELRDATPAQLQEAFRRKAAEKGDRK